MIYKGCQKRMIMLKNTGSEIFDEAYFILKEKAEKSRISENDMVREANRIIDEKLLCGCYKNGSPTVIRERLKTLFWYTAGALSCGGVIGIAALIV